MYLDDGLCAVAGEPAAQKESQLVQDTLEKAGFIAHPSKSVWQPTQRLIWLGFVVDLALGQIEVLQDKLLTLQSILQQAIHNAPRYGQGAWPA